MILKTHVLLLFTGLMLTFTACSNNSVKPASHAHASTAKVHESKHHTTSNASKESRSISVLDLSAIKGIDAIIPALAKHRAVLVGERHTAYGDHLNQLAIIKGLHSHWKDMAIGLEFVQQPYQKALDAYVAGGITEQEMLQQTEWYDRWKYDFRLYRPIFKFAQKNKIPLIALNIPQEISKKISKGGISGLSPKERQQIPQSIDKSNKAYRKHLKDIYSLHMKTRSKGFEHFYEAQLAWDEGMADTAANYLLKHPVHNMVVLAGGGHMINRHGIPARLERRINAKTAVVLNHSSDKPNASEGDFLLLAPPVKLPKKGMLGIFMDNTDKGVHIIKLDPKGAAEKAGLKVGDLLLSIDNHIIKKTGDVRIALLGAMPGKKVKVSLSRTNKKQLKTVVLK